ncbi:MAG TPA: hypothetical protein VGI40_19445 [Pirellulaceae bacterium]
MTHTILLAPIFVLVPMLAWAQPELTPPAPPPNALPPNVLPEQPAEQEGVEALTKGPIHEAFADPAMPDPQPSPVIAKAPPADVPEQPAAYKPEGDFIWIPGYWSWDDDRDDFVWVTGVWRQPPPDMRWVPGYWQEASSGWQRVKGFWVQNETQDVVYYNQPPASLEAGPSSPAPASNSFWIPGSWTYANANTGFNWQAGYWAPYQQDWVYVPARWMWSPAGYVYVPGYWDYRLGSRGQIFAPVYFQRPVYAQAGWLYRPSIVIPTGNLFIHLWTQPRYGSYFFGNYFGPQYANRGFVAWSNLPSQRHGYYYDPFYSYAHVHYRQQGIDYLGRVQGWHNYYAEHPEHRPPATFHAQREWLQSPAAAGVGHDAQLVARPIGEIARQGDSPIKLTHLNDHALQTQAQQVKQIRELDVQRKNLEREHAQVNLSRPTDANDQLRDRSKTGPLVDRVEKGGKGEKGRDLLPGQTAAETSKAGPTAKLSLPKVDLPKSDVVSTRTSVPGDATKLNDRGAPPLPRADNKPRGSGRQSISNLPQNALPDSGKSSSRSTFGAKTGDSVRLPGAANESRNPSRDVGVQKGGGRDSGDGVSTGRLSNDTPIRGGEIPGLPPGGRTNSGAQTRDRLTQPGGGPSGSDPPGNSSQGKSPSFTPRDFSSPKAITPPIGNRDRGAQRNDQPTFPGVGSKSGGGNVNPAQPQPQRGSGRQEGGGSTKDDSKKGKGRG